MRGFVCNAAKIGRTKQENLCCLFIENQWLHPKGFWGLFFSSIVSMGCLKQGFAHTISSFLDCLVGEAEWMLNQERLPSPLKWSGGILTFCWPGDIYSDILNKGCESDSPPQLPYKCARYHFKMLCVWGGWRLLFLIAGCTIQEEIFWKQTFRICWQCLEFFL